MHEVKGPGNAGPTEAHSFQFITREKYKNEKHHHPLMHLQGINQMK